MPYSQFTNLAKAKAAFNLKTVENIGFLRQIEPIQASSILTAVLESNMPLAVAAGSEKARSELIISPVLVEVRRILKSEISLFSGEDFNVDESLGLNGRCDFLISRSPELLDIEAPVVVIIEAKIGNLKSGIGQCMAAMVAAQKFNLARDKHFTNIYGAVSDGIQWQFLQLEGTTVTIDLHIYNLPPVEQILGCLVWMIEKE